MGFPGPVGTPSFAMPMLLSFPFHCNCSSASSPGLDIRITDEYLCVAVCSFSRLSSSSRLLKVLSGGYAIIVVVEADVWLLLPSEKKFLAIDRRILVVNLTLQVYVLTNQYKIETVSRESLIVGHPV